MDTTHQDTNREQQITKFNRTHKCVIVLFCDVFNCAIKFDDCHVNSSRSHRINSNKNTKNFVFFSSTNSHWNRRRKKNNWAKMIERSHRQTHMHARVENRNCFLFHLSTYPTFGYFQIIFVFSMILFCFFFFNCTVRTHERFEWMNEWTHWKPNMENKRMDSIEWCWLVECVLYRINDKL